MVALLLPAAGILALFVLHKLQVARPEILDPRRGSTTIGRMTLYALLLSGAFLFFCLALQIVRDAPWRTFMVIALLIFGGTALVAVETLPTRSQDVYWNLLLAKGFTERGLNPYTTTPHRLADDPWSGPVAAWRGLSMTHGPLWVLFLSLITAMGQPLLMSLRLVKWAALLTLAASGFLVWKIMEIQGCSEERKAKVMASLSLNPFIIQTVLIDAHNDVYVMLSILGSYLLLISRKEVTSALCLILGGFVKFVPWILLPIPLLRLFTSRGARSSVAAALGLLFAGVALGAALYAPFGFSSEVFAGLREEMTARGWSAFYWPGSALLASLFSMGPGDLRVAGLVAGLLALAIAMVRDRPAWGYTAPCAVILFFGTAWFHPWHALWIFPLLALLLPLGVQAVLSIPLIINELEPVGAQWAVVGGLLAILSIVDLAGRRRGVGKGAVREPSRTSRTLAARSSGVNGFWRNAVPDSRTPRRTIASSVYPDM